MAGCMKTIDGFVSRIAKLLVSMILLALLTQTSQQDIGKVGFCAVITEILLNMFPVLYEYRSSG